MTNYNPNDRNNSNRYSGSSRPPYGSSGSSRPPYGNSGSSRPPYGNSGSYRPPYGSSGTPRSYNRPSGARYTDDKRAAKTLSPNGSSGNVPPRGNRPPRKKNPLPVIIIIVLILALLYKLGKTPNTNSNSNPPVVPTTVATTREATTAAPTTKKESPTTKQKVTEAKTEVQTTTEEETKKPDVYYFESEKNLLKIGTPQDPIQDLYTLEQYLSFYYREHLDEDVTVYLQYLDPLYLQDKLIDYDTTFVHQISWEYPSNVNNQEPTAFKFSRTPTPEAYVYNYQVKGIPIPSDEKMANELNRAVERILSETVTSDMNALEIEYAIHDYMTHNCAYGLAPNQQTAYGCLVDQICVCQGYTQAFELLMLCNEIECHYVAGDGSGESHSWNQINLGNNWYNVDVTWDDPVSDPGSVVLVSGQETHAYLNVDDSRFKETHSWNADAYNTKPANSMDLNYYRQYGLFYNDYSEYQWAVCNYINSDETETFYCAVTDYSEDVYSDSSFVFDMTYYSGGIYTSYMIVSPDYVIMGITKEE